MGTGMPVWEICNGAGRAAYPGFGELAGGFSFANQIFGIILLGIDLIFDVSFTGHDTAFAIW
jgi:hypothetical protein